MSRWQPIAIRVLACAFVGLSSIAAICQESNEDQPPDPDTGESTIAERTLGLLPNPYERLGIKFAATYISEVLGNATGGVEQGATFEGRLNLALDVDFDKLAGRKGMTAHANVFVIHGDGLSRTNLQNYFVVSGIEALPAARLYEAYFEQKFFDDKWSIRAGQLAADSEFLASKYTDVFTNASMGWPAITSINLPAGGPAPPLAAVGARLYGKLSDNITVLTAIFDGDSAGPGVGDPQQRNRFGLNFRVNDPPLVLGEMQFTWNNIIPGDNRSGTLKIGGWHHFGTFTDQRFTADGRSVADPGGSGLGQRLQADDGIYSVIEQKVYSVANSKDRGIGAFMRTSASPSDRNLIDLYTDAGIDFIGFFDQRQNDKFGVAVGYAHVSRRAQALDRDYRFFTAQSEWPVRTSEALFTASYLYEIKSGWNLLPNYQYIFRPGGGATDPAGITPGIRLRDASVFGIRSVMKF
ncbi:carbohydrate porin [uncultured Bradyrhizobium sp.]|uniref:carbohydrate porin n=1 Tax=uncultured Bradyrhizobium sp. TaxID=199684 RepID=UPI0035CC5350